MRPDAGRPAEGEGEAQDIGPEGRPAPVARIHPHLPVHEGDAVDAQEMGAEDHDDDPGDGDEPVLIRQEEPPEGRGGEPQEQEHRRQPHDEEQRRQHHPPPPRPLLPHLGHADPAHVGKVRRHDGQNAGAEERQHPRQKRHGQRGQKREVEEIYAEHVPPPDSGSRGPRHAGAGHKAVDKVKQAAYPAAMDWDHDIDAEGLLCPLPVLRAAKALARDGDRARF